MNEMKSRQHIEKLIGIEWARNPEVTYDYLILEVLLDIRDMLENDIEQRR